MKIVKGENGLFSIEVEGTIIGGGSMIEDDTAMSYLDGIEILEEHRNQGHGTKALYALRDTYGSYHLAPTSEDARRLYERIADEMRDDDYNRFGFAIDQGFGVYEM